MHIMTKLLVFTIFNMKLYTVSKRKKIKFNIFVKLICYFQVISETADFGYFRVTYV